MESSSADQQQQMIGQKKGWLSRWTRKQWSRHWFVLKNGSLTYYRGQAAEMCSFLDGVLDLSLIKHIEVQQDEPKVVTTTVSHQHSYHNYLNYHGSNQHAVGQQQHHFTFTLKMWNGECHVLGAPTAAERSMWLDAINLCTGYGQDEETATDSASSSDSSPTSNLSARSTDVGSGIYPNFSHASFGLLRSSNLTKPQCGKINAQQHEVAKVRSNSSKDDSAITKTLKQTPTETLQYDTGDLRDNNLNKHLSSHEDGSISSSSNKKLVSSQASSEANTVASKQQHSSENQVLKRRLISVLGQSYQERQPLGDLSRVQQATCDDARTASRCDEEPLKLVARHQLQSRADMYARTDLADSACQLQQAPRDEELAMSVVTDSSEDEKDEGEHNGKINEAQVDKVGMSRTLEDGEHQSRFCLESSAQTTCPTTNSDYNRATKGQQVRPPYAPKKRVTFDLSFSSLHQLTSSSSDSGSANTSSGGSDSSGSPLSISPSASSDEEDEDEHRRASNSEASQPALIREQEGTKCGEAGTCSSKLMMFDKDELPTDHSFRPADGAAHSVGDSTYRLRLDAEKRRGDELEAKLEEAQANISLLETKLKGSYTNCGQLELTCQRLRDELEKCQEAHKSDMGRMKVRSDALSRELLVKEAKLVELRDKMAKYEELLLRQQQQQHLHYHSAQTRSASKALNCWLKQVGQQSAINGSSFHQPALLPMSHIKQTLHSVANQQHVSLKLLNHSKQIQRKLNELELKVDKISNAADPAFDSRLNHHQHAHTAKPLVN